jgi:hypothetical protein
MFTSGLTHEERQDAALHKLLWKAKWNAYVMPPGHLSVFDMTSRDVSRFFLQLPLSVTYTPLSIGADGKIYTQNDGHLLVLGAGKEPDPQPATGRH